MQSQDSPPQRALNFSSRWQRGVTLIEACAVMAITVILAAAAAPAMQALLDARRLEGASSQLATDIQFVRTLAVARNEPVRLSLYFPSARSCYVIHTGDRDQCNCDEPGPAQCNGDARQIKTVHMASSDRVSVQGSVSSVLMNPLHGTISPAGTLCLVGAQGPAVHHTINVMGRVHSCQRPANMSDCRKCPA